MWKAGNSHPKQLEIWKLRPPKSGNLEHSHSIDVGAQKLKHIPTPTCFSRLASMGLWGGTIYVHVYIAIHIIYSEREREWIHYVTLYGWNYLHISHSKLYACKGCSFHGMYVLVSCRSGLGRLFQNSPTVMNMDPSSGAPWKTPSHAWQDLPN